MIPSPLPGRRLAHRVSWITAIVLTALMGLYLGIYAYIEGRRYDAAIEKDFLLLEAVLSSASDRFSDAFQIGTPDFLLSELTRIARRVPGAALGRAYDARGRILASWKVPQKGGFAFDGLQGAGSGTTRVGDVTVAWVSRPVHLRSALGSRHGPLLGHVVLGASQEVNARAHRVAITLGIAFGLVILAVMVVAVNWVTSRSLLPFFRLVENAREPIAVHHGGNFVYVNPALCSLLGYPGAPDLLGRRFLELVHPDDRAVAQSSAERAIAGEAVPVQEIRVLRRDGGTVSIEALAQRVEFGEGPAVLLLGRDVTQRKEMERQLARSDRLASLGTLAAGVAHEINNPLAFILGNLEFAREELPALARSQAGARPEPLLAEVLEALREAADGAKRVSRIVRDLGVFARGEDEKREPVDVHKTLEAAIAIATNEIRHRARLVKTLEPVPRVIADEARLTQVFLNLLVNAAQAIGEGRAEDNEIRVATRVDASERIVVEVADTGEGIPAAILPRIFDPFFTTKPVNLGTGLGLSICHGIVSALGGEITVESELGHGTTFRVLLPPAPAAGTAPSPPADLVPPGGPRARVLIVDDEPAVLSALRRTLGRDHDVVAAASPEALEILLSDDRFDLVLCDLMMPELSGMALYERVRRSRPELAERFVFMTGGAFTTGAREFLDRVRLRTLHKPFAPGEIARLVAERARAGEARRGTGA